MKQEFSGISSTPSLVEIDDTSWLSDDSELQVSSFKAQLSMSRVVETTIHIEGNIQYSICFSCDRCGVSFDHEVKEKFTYVVKNDVDSSLLVQEKECTEEEINTVYLQEPIVDIGDILLEQFYLSIPVQRVCDEDCKGLCSVCGLKIEADSCSCEKDMSSSPFAVLSKLKK